ncbi:sodium:solute symporter family transporter [Erythrobacter sp. NE805]|uniref:sodium:solute symporter family transporter n=1 Tax=Erythrobacter sp. NE805 TaxID=3389875 RepID=UPI00396B1B75
MAARGLPASCGGTFAITLTLILAYVAAQIALAVWANRGATSDADYLLAGRRLGSVAVGMSLFATWFASETLLATSSEVAANGLAGARAEPFAYAAGILCIALFVAARLRRGGFFTIADFLRTRYDPRTEVLSAVVIALAAVTWSGAQLYAFAALIDTASGLGFGPSLVAAALLVTVYTMLGGLAGDVVTDMVQGAMLVAAMLLIFWLMLEASGGPLAAWQAIPPEALRLTVPGEHWSERLELWLIPVVGTLVSQEALARTLAARSPEVARRGAFLGAGVYLAAGLIPVSFGLVGPQLVHLVGPDAAAMGEAFLPTLAQGLLPPWLTIVFTGALISAILSSVNSALMAASAVATESGYRRWRPAAEGPELLRAARGATVLASLVAALLAAGGESLRSLVLDAEAISAVLAVPLVAALVGIRASGRAASAAICVQLAATVVLDRWLGVPGAFLWVVSAGLASFALVGWLDRPRPAPAPPLGAEEA